MEAFRNRAVGKYKGRIMNTQLSQEIKRPIYSEYELGAMDCMFTGNPKEHASQEYLDGFGDQYAQEQQNDRGFN